MLITLFEDLLRINTKDEIVKKTKKKQMRESPHDVDSNTIKESKYD